MYLIGAIGLGKSDGARGECVQSVEIGWNVALVAFEAISRISEFFSDYFKSRCFVSYSKQVLWRE